MSIQSSTNRIDFTPGGGVKVFPFTFPVYNQSDLLVYTVDTSFTVMQRTRNGAGAYDYTQTAVNVPGGTAGGNVTFNTAPDSFLKVIIIRTVPLTQPSAYTNFIGIDGKLDLEKAYDNLC